MTAALALVALLGLAISRPGEARQDAAPAPAPRIADVRQELDDVVGRFIAGDRLGRPDGYIYAIDVGLLLLAAALGEQRQRYHVLRARAGELVIERPPGLKGPVVVWRRPRGRVTPPDASGTTEALQLAHALLVGADAFDRPEDARLAGRLLDGYVEHAAVLDGVWLVRNYYNLQSRTFATNSFLIDYAPDLLVQAAERRARDPRQGDPSELRAVARRSVALVRTARRPNGLIDAMVQPELRTLFPFVVFSPNDIIELEHCALIAEQVTATAPDVAWGLLHFAAQRLPVLHAAYTGSTGRPYGEERADAGTLAGLARVAVKLGARGLIERLRGPLAQHAQTLVRRGDSLDVHVAAQTLLGLRLIELSDRGQAIPWSAPR